MKNFLLGALLGYLGGRAHENPERIGEAVNVIKSGAERLKDLFLNQEKEVKRKVDEEAEDE